MQVIGQLEVYAEDMTWRKCENCGDLLQNFIAGRKALVYARLYIGIADGMSIARVWACRYSK